MWSLASEFSADYYTGHPGIVSLLMLTITHIQAMALYIYIYIYIYIYTQGRFNNHTARSFYMILAMTTNVMGVMKMGNIVP